MTQDRANRLVDAAIVLFSVAIFVAIASYSLNLPGLYNDEAMDVVGAMQLLKGQPLELQRGAALHLGGLTLPLMNSDYQGVVSTYLVLPFFALLGITTVSLRLMTISAGVAAIVLTYFAGKALFDRPTALLSVALLAVFPCFIFWSRVGIYVVAEVVPLSLGSLLCFLAWWRRGRERYLYLGAFCLGLGLSTKLLFLWYITALGGTAVALSAPALLGWYRQRARWPAGERLGHLPRGWFRLLSSSPSRLARNAVLSLAAFGIGAFPFLYYNLLTRGTYLVLRANLATSDRGVSNSAFIPNLLTELDALKVLLDGSYFWFQGGIFTNPLYPALFAVSGVALIGMALWVSALRRYRASVAFVLILTALILLQSCFTVSGLWATHLLILVPLPQILIAAFLTALYTAVRDHLSSAELPGGAAPFQATWKDTDSEQDPIGATGRPPQLALGQYAKHGRANLAGRTSQLISAAVLVVAISVAGALAALDLKVDVQYYQALNRSGGYYSFSDAIYGLATYLDNRKAKEPAAMDWGIKPAVQILTEGRVNPKEVYGFEPGAEAAFYDRVQTLLTDPNRLYLFHTDESTAYPRFDAFDAAVKKVGKHPILEKTFFHRDGKPLYLVYRVD